MKTTARIKRNERNTFFSIVTVMLGLLFLFPLYWMLKTSLIMPKELFTVPPTLMPHTIVGDNYRKALTAVPFLLQLGNSVFVAVLNVLGTTFTASLTAYAFARLHFRFQNVWFALILGTLMLPAAVTLIPQYMMWYHLGTIGTFLPVTLPAWCGGGSYFIFLLRQFFRTIPKELDESAKIDGAGYFRIYWQIILPLVVPALVVVILFSFINAWNEFFNSVIYLTDPIMHTLTLGLYKFKGVYQSDYGAIMALSAIVMAPTFLFFMIGNRYFVEGVALSGIKG
jgi:multiple sugar transport system permease protein